LIHVSYRSRVDHIITWYEDIFKELARQKDLELPEDFHDEVVRQRVIMNFKQVQRLLEGRRASVQ